MKFGLVKMHQNCILCTKLWVKVPELVFWMPIINIYNAARNSSNGRIAKIARLGNPEQALAIGKYQRRAGQRLGAKWEQTSLSLSDLMIEYKYKYRSEYKRNNYPNTKKDRAGQGQMIAKFSPSVWLNDLIFHEKNHDKTGRWSSNMIMSISCLETK